MFSSDPTTEVAFVLGCVRLDVLDQFRIFEAMMADVDARRGRPSLFPLLNLQVFRSAHFVSVRLYFSEAAKAFARLKKWS